MNLGAEEALGVVAASQLVAIGVFVFFRPPEGADPDILDVVGVLPDAASAEAEAARRDALAGDAGPRHWVQILVYLRVTEVRELP